MKQLLLRITVTIVPVMLGLLLLRSSIAQEPSSAKEPVPSDVSQNEKPPESDEVEEEIPRVSLEVARDRARLLHEVYLSTLDVMHRRYFHGDRAVVPARAMQDVFEDMQRSKQIEARWIAVNLKAMSIDHEPKSDFEKHSARKIKAGDREVEAIDEGYYRRTVAVPLAGGCVHCHDGFFRSPSPTAKFAGLVISIPVRDGESLEEAAPSKK